jgi:hypothetical protein
MRCNGALLSMTLMESALLAAASCGGGGGSHRAPDVAPDPALNQGAFTAADFEYSDPNPPAFHPLLSPVYIPWTNDEATFLVGSTGQGWMRDDVDTNFDSSQSLPSGANSDMVVIDSKSADLFGNGRPSLVVLGTFADPTDSGRTKLRVRVLADPKNPDGTNTWTILGSFDVGAPGENYLGGRLAIGDLDGDYRDEIVVAATHDTNSSWVRVFSIPVDNSGNGVLKQSFDYPNTDQVRVISAQLDDDPALELVVHTGLGTAALGIVYDDASTGYAVLNPALYEYDSGINNVELLAANVDDDTLQEIAVLLTESGMVQQIVFDDARAGFEQIRTYDRDIWQQEWSAFNPALMQRGTVADLDGDGKDEIIWTVISGDWMCGVEILWGDGSKTDFTLLDNTHDWRAINITALDDDHDNRKELVVGAIERDYTTGADTCHWWRFDYDDAKAKLDVTQEGTRSVGSADSLVMSGDDFDCDGCRLRYNGNKYQQLPFPIPLAILAAPPTKANIMQDGAASSVGYTMTSGTKTVDTYKNTISASIGGGVDLSALKKKFELEVEVKLKGDIEFNTGTEDVTTNSLSFTGGYDHDVVVFIGTLHMVYEYEVLVADDPSIVGTVMTVNIPVGTKTYKWTRELVESTFGKDTLIPAGVLTHTIGDPASYKRQGNADGLLQEYVGWKGNLVTVGQGDSTNAVTLNLEHTDVDENGWSAGIEVDARVKFGSKFLEAGISYDHSELYSTLTSKGTSFNGTIADIGGKDWSEWGYDVGLFVYMLTPPNEMSVKVIDFWTDPWGGSYQVGH